MQGRPLRPGDVRIEVDKMMSMKQMAEASKYLMACAKQQTQSALNTERLTKTMTTLTWIIGALTLLSLVTVVFSVLNPLFHWIN